MPPKTYNGPVCYVGQPDSAVALDGTVCDPGWHYTAVVDEEAKAIAVDAAKAQVALWEKRAGRRGVGRLVQAQLDAARGSLAAVEAASFEVPGEKLYLDGDTYRLAKDDDESWHERHHERFAVIAPGGNVGIPHDAEAVAATHDHFDRLEKRLGETGLDQHEGDHIYTSPDEIAHGRRWLATLPQAAEAEKLRRRHGLHAADEDGGTRG